MESVAVADFPVLRTDRGFPYITFYDLNENPCTLQRSSLICPRVWLGRQGPGYRMHLRAEECRILEAFHNDEVMVETS
jgi:hypothetical protein